MRRARHLAIILLTVLLCAVLSSCATPPVQEKIEVINDDGTINANAVLGLIGSEYNNVRVPSDYDLFEADTHNYLYPEDSTDKRYIIFNFDGSVYNYRQAKVVNSVGIVGWSNAFDPEALMRDNFSSVDMDVVDSYYQVDELNPNEWTLGLIGNNANNDLVCAIIADNMSTFSRDDLGEGGLGLASALFDSAKEAASTKPGFVSPAV